MTCRPTLARRSPKAGEDRPEQIDQADRVGGFLAPEQGDDVPDQFAQVVVVRPPGNDLVGGNVACRVALPATPLADGHRAVGPLLHVGQTGDFALADVVDGELEVLHTEPQ